MKYLCYNVLVCVNWLELVKGIVMKELFEFLSKLKNMCIGWSFYFIINYFVLIN